VIEKLKTLLKRAESWPEEAQEEAAASLAAIEHAYLREEPLSDEDIEALQRSGEDVRVGMFATESEVRELLARYRNIQ
jgi:hypothetical protein